MRKLGLFLALIGLISCEPDNNPVGQNQVIDPSVLEAARAYLKGQEGPSRSKNDLAFTMIKWAYSYKFSPTQIGFLTQKLDAEFYLSCYRGNCEIKERE